MENNRKYFFISDTHFNHSKIIEYCNRPFNDTKMMNETIIHNWNSVVSDNDIVYHLGDVGLGDREELKTIIPNLKGIKFLIKGNHDTRSNDFYRECGFKEVYDHPIIIKDFIVLSHEPMPFILNQCYHNIFGHIHDSPMFETKGEHHTCVCVERWNYTPVQDINIFGHSLHGFGNRTPISYDNKDGEKVIHHE